MDPGTKCFITTSEEGDIKALDFSDMAKKLEKLKRIEQVGGREEGGRLEHPVRASGSLNVVFLDLSGAKSGAIMATVFFGGWNLLHWFSHSLLTILQKASGLPEESVPQDMARKLNPYIRQVQRDGYEDRMHLFSFPPVLGVKSYFLDVPDMTGAKRGIN